jgi:hypothetical protein
MSKHGKYGSADVYLSEITKRLKAEHFRIDKNITYRNQTFDYVAKRTRYEIDKSGFAATFFLFARFSSLDISSLRNFSKISFKYAVRAGGTIPLAGGIPLPRGLFLSIVCYPVAIVDTIDKDTVETLRSKAPPKHWVAGEMPVVYSLASKTLYYCEITPMWGALYYGQMRQTINNMLAP